MLQSNASWREKGHWEWMMMMMKGGLAWGYPFPCCPEEEHLQRSIEIDTNQFGLFFKQCFCSQYL